MQRFKRIFKELFSPPNKSNHKPVELEKFAFQQVEERINAVEGWLVPGQEFWLFSAARKLRPGARIVEIGSFKGRSTVCLAFACINTNKHIFAIDPWQGIYRDVEERPDLRPIFDQGFFDIWERNIRVNQLQDYVTPLVGRSSKIAKVWRAPIDMLFVDGSHKYEDVIADFENFFPYVVPGGLLAFHDVTPNWEGSWQAWNNYIETRLSNTGFCTTIGFGYKPC